MHGVGGVRPLAFDDDPRQAGSEQGDIREGAALTPPGVSRQNWLMARK